MVKYIPPSDSNLFCHWIFQILVYFYVQAAPSLKGAPSILATPSKNWDHLKLPPAERGGGGCAYYGSARLIASHKTFFHFIPFS